MNLKQYFTSQYLFKINPAFIDSGEKLMGLLGVVLVLLAAVLKISAVLAPTPLDKKYRNKFYSLFLTIGLLEVFWYLCRYENVRFFGTRFVAWLYLLVGLVWLVSLLVKTMKNYKPEKLAWEKEQLKGKYLPK